MIIRCSETHFKSFDFLNPTPRCPLEGNISKTLLESLLLLSPWYYAASLNLLWQHIYFASDSLQLLVDHKEAKYFSESNIISPFVGVMLCPLTGSTLRPFPLNMCADLELLANLTLLGKTNCHLYRLGI